MVLPFWYQLSAHPGSPRQRAVKWALLLFLFLEPELPSSLVIMFISLFEFYRVELLDDENAFCLERAVKLSPNLFTLSFTCYRVLIVV